MGLGGVCSFHFDKPLNKKDFNGEWFLKATPIAHMQPIHFKKNSYNITWAFHSTRTRDLLRIFD